MCWHFRYLYKRVGEIGPYSPFYRNIMSSFSADFKLPKNLQTQTVSAVKLLKTLLCQKAVRKMVVKLTLERFFRSYEKSK